MRPSSVLAESIGPLRRSLLGAQKSLAGTYAISALAEGPWALPFLAEGWRVTGSAAFSGGPFVFVF